MSVLTDDFRPTPLWLDEAPLQPANEELPARVDVAVVGSGYCGLCAARVLAAAGASVLVLDAGDPGAGASTRNHGHIGGGGKLPPKLDALVGAERAALIRQDTVDSTDFVRDLIADERLPVDYAQRGRFLAAHSPGAFRKLHARADAMRRLRLSVDVVPRDRQREEIGSDFYHGGITIAEAGALQPAKLHREMRRLAEEAGAAIRGQARVEAVSRVAGGYHLQTGRGAVQAEQVVIATNAYSGAATPFVRDRIVPVTAYMIATEPMGEELARDVLPRNPWNNTLLFALMADGVAPDKLFPLDLDRAFRKLDEIKPAIDVWWKTGAQSVDMFRSGDIQMAPMWSGTAYAAKQGGLSLDWTYDQAAADLGSWAVLKGAPHPNAALAFIDFYMANPQNHAAFAREMGYATTNQEGLALLSPALKHELVSSPATLAHMAAIDGAWVEANRAATLDRWNTWLAG